MLLGPLPAFKVRKTQYVRMLLGRRYKFLVNLRSSFLDAQQKHCSQMKLKTKCVQLCLPNLMTLLLIYPCAVKLFLQDEKMFSLCFFERRRSPMIFDPLRYNNYLATNIKRLFSTMRPRKDRHFPNVDSSATRRAIEACQVSKESSESLGRLEIVKVQPFSQFLGHCCAMQNSAGTKCVSFWKKTAVDILRNFI